MLIQRFPRPLLFGRMGHSWAQPCDALRQFNNQVRLSRLDAQVGPEGVRCDCGGGVRDLPFPGGPTRIIRIVVLPDAPPECLSQKGRHLGRHLIQADNADVVRGGLATPARSPVSARYQNGAVAIDATGKICPQSLIHAANSIIRTQCQRLGTVRPAKQLGSQWAHEHGSDGKGGDWSLWPEDLRIREFPVVAEAVSA